MVTGLGDTQVSFPTTVWTMPLCFKRKVFSQVEVSHAVSLAVKVKERAVICFIYKCGCSQGSDSVWKINVAI